MFGRAPTRPQIHPGTGRDLSVEMTHTNWGATATTPEHPQVKIMSVMGVDLGQASDRSAATILESSRYPEGFVGPQNRWINLKKIRRYPANLDYMLQVDDLLAYPDLDFMVVEYNGVGRPVVDRLMQRAREVGFKGRIIPIITAISNSRMHEVVNPRGFKTVSVPKINMVTSINLLTQSGNLRIEEGKDRETDENLVILQKEMRDFQLRITAAANYVMGAEGKGKHDDIAMSFALCSWFVMNRQRATPAVYVP